jgi:hypothetical protein
MAPKTLQDNSKMPSHADTAAAQYQYLKPNSGFRARIETHLPKIEASTRKILVEDPHKCGEAIGYWAYSEQERNLHKYDNQTLSTDVSRWRSGIGA